MEIVSPDGSTTKLKPGQTLELGRSNGFDSSDKTISRRHVTFSVPTFKQSKNIQFEVIGRNPIYINQKNEVKVYRRFERGEMGDGDMFCVSSNNPVWYTLRGFGNCGEGVRRNVLENKLAGNLEGDVGEDFEEVGFDFSGFDTVKEFGFLVVGHEFDSYPKKMIRDMKNWDWFLEEPRKDDSEDEDGEEKKGKGSGRRKRKKGKENDDEEEWAGESEDDKVLIDKSRKAQKLKYVTRSKDRGKQANKDPSNSGSTMGEDDRGVDDEDVEDEDEDEEDETLGGFIVDDEKLEDEEEIGDEDDEEEEELIDEDEDDNE